MKKRILAFLIAIIFILPLFPAISAAEEKYTQAVPFKYDWARPFSEGLAAVAVGNWETGFKWGFIDKDGNEIVPLIYDYVNDFSEDTAAVMINNKMGFIDKNGNIVIPIIYDGAMDFSEGLAAVSINNKYGFIDKTGNEVISFKYDIVQSFSEGLAAVMIREEWHELEYDYTQWIDRWGFIDKDGNEIIPLKYESASGFSEGLAMVVSMHRWFSPEYRYYISWVDGAKVDFIDKNGNIIPPPEKRYNIARDFSDDRAVVGLLRIGPGGISIGQEYYWGVIDKNGKEIVPLKYDLIHDFSDGLAVIGRYIGHTGRGGGPVYEYGVIDKNGDEVIPFKYNNIMGFSEGIAAVSINGKWGFIDKNEKEIVPFIYDYVGDFSEGMAAVSIGGKWGYITILPEKPSPWAEPEVNAAIEAGIVPQDLQKLYDAPITRAEFTALAVTLYEKITGEEIAERKTFIDTNDINVEKAAAIGVVLGVGENRFDPNGTLTREQAATMLSRLADIINHPLPEHTATFNDNNKIEEWAFDAVGQMQITGIMQGMGDNRFAPNDPYTREQSIMTIFRLFEIVF